MTRNMKPLTFGTSSYLNLLYTGTCHVCHIPIKPTPHAPRPMLHAPFYVITAR